MSFIELNRKPRFTVVFTAFCSAIQRIHLASVCYACIVQKFSEAYSTFVHSVEFICYDDGCHLRKFSQNPVRSTLTDITVHIAKMEIVLDRFHFPNHTDDWCKKTCNPYNFMELDEVI